MIKYTLLVFFIFMCCQSVNCWLSVLKMWSAPDIL